MENHQSDGQYVVDRKSKYNSMLIIVECVSHSLSATHFAHKYTVAGQVSYLQTAL